MWVMILRTENEARVKVFRLLYDDELSKPPAVQIHIVSCVFLKLFMFIVKTKTVTDKKNSITCILRKYYVCVQHPQLHGVLPK
jgi:hypothetical protein